MTQVVIRTLKVNRSAAASAVQGDFLNATDLADYLVRKGLAFRKAHELVGKIVLHCEQRGIQLQELSLTEYQGYSGLFGEDVFVALSLDNSLGARSVFGGTARVRVAEALEQAELFLTKRGSTSLG